MKMRQQCQCRRSPCQGVRFGTDDDVVVLVDGVGDADGGKGVDGGEDGGAGHIVLIQYFITTMYRYRIPAFVYIYSQIQEDKGADTASGKVCSR